MNWPKNLVHNRFVIFISFAVLFVVANFIATGTLLPSTATKDLWFYSGLFMVVFSTLFIEPYYSSPKNVIANVVPLLLVFLAIKTEFSNDLQWWLIMSLLITILITSILAMSLEDKNQSPDSKRNKLSTRLKDAVILVGRGKVLYSATFLYFLFTYYVYSKNISGYIFFLLILWAFILLINPKELTNVFLTKKHADDDAAIGQIFGIQSKRIFLVRLFENRKSIRKFNVVKFKYSMQDEDGIAMTGIVFDNYLLNQEKWAKVLQLDSIPIKSGEKLTKNTVYKIYDSTEKKELSKKLSLDSFVGIVGDGSDIGRIKFEYSKKEDNLQEGDLLELNVGPKKLFYQVVAGITDKERLEARNESGFIKGEAVQLGEWKNAQASFTKFGWVPQINTPIFKADTNKINPPKHKYPEYKLGVIPGTSLPSIINLEDAVSHHMALIGVTGSGKSYLAKQIIEKLMKDTKIICIDFTGEWKKSIEGAVILDRANIDAFLSGEEAFGIVELPAMSNTVEVVAATEKLLSIVFNYAKKMYEDGNLQKICLVLEEAHTIVPEASFLGVNNWDSKAVVNKMGQIALQGRKYGVGMLVIAQRTANVSKTVLTQCNTVICFQAFDETSFAFLGNYVGRDMVDALPNLKQYHAVVAGKASRSNVPIIVDLK